VNRHLKQSREEMVEERDQRRLAAEVQLQRLLVAPGFEQNRRHLTKHIDVCTTKSINRLLAIADDEEICGPPTLRERESFEQHTLHCIRVLKLVDEEEPITLRRTRDHFGSLKKVERS